jgi:hypothetical protein
VAWSAMAEAKTRPTTENPLDVVAGIDDDQRRRDCLWLIEAMTAATGEPPIMWGPSIIGFGSFAYQGSSTAGDWPIIGFGPKTKALSVYVMPGFDALDDVLQRLGPHTHGKGCLYLKSLARVDTAALRELIDRTVAEMGRRTNGGTAPYVAGESQYATSLAKVRADARKTAPKKAATKKAATKKKATKKATKKTATKATKKKTSGS